MLLLMKFTRATTWSKFFPNTIFLDLHSVAIIQRRAHEQQCHSNTFSILVTHRGIKVLVLFVCGGTIFVYVGIFCMCCHFLYVLAQLYLLSLFASTCFMFFSYTILCFLKYAYLITVCFSLLKT